MLQPVYFLGELAILRSQRELIVFLFDEAVLQELDLAVQHCFLPFKPLNLQLVVISHVGLLGGTRPSLVPHQLIFFVAAVDAASHNQVLDTLHQLCESLRQPFALKLILVALDSQLLHICELADSFGFLQLFLRRLKLLLQLFVLPLHSCDHVGASPEHLLLVLHVQLRRVFSSFTLSLP